MEEEVGVVHGVEGFIVVDEDDGVSTTECGRVRVVG